MRILVCNAGSTSLKFALYDMPSEAVLCRARAERVGNPSGGSFTFTRGETAAAGTEIIPDYRAGIELFLSKLTDAEKRIDTVGFKTVLSRGYLGVHRIDADVLSGMEAMLGVAPAHNRCYLAAIRTFMQVMPGVPLVGVFETAFHRTMPPESYIYPVPYEWYEKYGVRRMGYHGASHSYVAACLTERLGKSYKAVSCHLGGSGSLCAIVDGECYDTSFGLSLQAGLPQGSRSGDIDPYLIFYMHDACGMDYADIERELTSNGGILGISGVSGDLRDVESAAAAGNPRAKLAIAVYCKSLAGYIGAYAAEMGGMDAVAFTGGIGENSETVRSYAMEHLRFLGLTPSGAAPVCGEVSRLTAEDSAVSAWVIPADEEIVVARKTCSLL